MGLFDGLSPDVPEGENPFLVYIAAVRGVLFPSYDSGFEPRLYILFGLAGYTVVVCLAYLVANWVDHRRRGKPFWVWRLVRRSNGTYLVGAQHVLFTVFACISCLIMIGYLNNCRRTFILHRFVERAFYWRSLVWVPMFVHGWVSSWANLQAAVLSSQRAAQTHILTPRIANGLYVGVLAVFLVIVITLDVYSAVSWQRFWGRVLGLRDVLFIGRDNFNATGVVNPADLRAVGAQFQLVQDQLSFFEKTQTAVSAIYIVAMAVLIAVNVAGLGLLLTLRKQISFNSRRFSSDVRSASAANASMAGGGVGGESTMPLPSPTRGSFSLEQGDQLAPLSPPAPAWDRRGLVATSFDRRGSVASSERRGSNATFDRRGSVASSERRGSGSPSERRTSVASTANGLMRKVFFAGPDIEEGNEGEEEKKETTHEPTRSELKEAAADQAPTAVALSQQAKQLMALKKVEWDLIVFVIATSALAAMFGGIQFWLAIATSTVYSKWNTVECALFIVPWAYLVTMAISTSFLLYNLLYHLAAPKGEQKVTSIGLWGLGAGQRHSTNSGITDERDRSTVGRVSMVGTRAGHEGEGHERPPIQFATSFPAKSQTEEK